MLFKHFKIWKNGNLYTAFIQLMLELMSNMMESYVTLQIKFLLSLSQKYRFLILLFSLLFRKIELTQNFLCFSDGLVKWKSETNGQEKR